MYSYTGQRSLDDFEIFFSEGYQEIDHESVPQKPLNFSEKLIKVITINHKAIRIAIALIVGVILIAISAKILLKNPAVEPVQVVPTTYSNGQNFTPINGKEEQQIPKSEKRKKKKKD